MAGVLATFRSSWMALLITAVARAMVSLVVSLVLTALIPAALGAHSTVTMSGSMEPRIMPGDVVIACPVAETQLAIGQILLVHDPDWPGRLRLHRLVRVDPNGRLVLEGDANGHPDSTHVAVNAIVGVACLRSPSIGLPEFWMMTRQFGALIGVGLLGGVIIGCCFLFETDGADGSGRPPPSRSAGRQKEGRASATLRPAARALAFIALTSSLLVQTCIPAYAAWSATTINAANSLASAPRFQCADRVRADSPNHYWKLSETAGPTAVDQMGNGSGTYAASGVTYGTAGPCIGDGDTAISLSGSSSVGISNSTAVNPAALTNYSEEIWFKSTSTAGGLLIGLFSNPTAVSADTDRILEMLPSGQLSFGNMGSGSATYAASSPSYNDGTWHLADAVYSTSTGGTLYVDGASVATSAPVTQFTGENLYWRIGYGDSSYAGYRPNGSGAPAAAFAGSVAEAATYTSALSSAQVSNHYGVRTQRCSTTVAADNPVRYWKLSEASGSGAADSSSAGTHGGTYAASGITYGTPGPCSVEGTTAISLSGASGVGVTTAAAGDSVASPAAFTEEIWFNTTSTVGGLLMALYIPQTGDGGNDRMLYINSSNKLVFGLYKSGFSTLVSPSTVNDGKWHLADASWSAAAGMSLYLDGALIGSTPGPSSNNSYTGYWRVGTGPVNSNGWPGATTAPSVTGSLAGAAVFNTVLSATRVAIHASSR